MVTIRHKRCVLLIKEFAYCFVTVVILIPSCYDVVTQETLTFKHVVIQHVLAELRSVVFRFLC